MEARAYPAEHAPRLRGVAGTFRLPDPGRKRGRLHRPVPRRGWPARRPDPHHARALPPPVDGSAPPTAAAGLPLAVAVGLAVGVAGGAVASTLAEALAVALASS